MVLNLSAFNNEPPKETSLDKIKKAYPGGDFSSKISQPLNTSALKPISVGETIRLQQKSAEELNPNFRTPFAKAPNVSISQDPANVLVSNLISRVPEMVVSIPVRGYNFFRVNIKALVGSAMGQENVFEKPVTENQFKTILGFDPNRFGITQEAIQDTWSKAYQEINKQNEINPPKNEFDKYKNSSIATAKTIVPDVLDALFGADIVTSGAKLALGATKASFRQLPESLLFKIQQENISPLAIRDALTGSTLGSPMEKKIAEDFIKKLSNEERKQVFDIAKSYEKAGLKVPIQGEVKQTALGKFAEAKLPELPKLPPKISGLLPGGKLSMEAGFLDIKAISNDIKNLAKSSKDITEFKNTLSPEQLKSLAIKGFTADTFYEASKGTPAIRYSGEGFENTDNFRGGTWYSTPESKTFDFSKEYAGKVGGSVKTEANLNIKNPLIIPKSSIEEGSFAVVNDGYENYLPKKERGLVNALKNAELDIMDSGDVWESIEPKIEKILKMNGNTPEEIDKVLRSTNVLDSANDLIISKGLKKEGYDALILENEFKGQVIDKHIFKFAEEKQIPQTTEESITYAKDNLEQLKTEYYKAAKEQYGVSSVVAADTAKTVIPGFSAEKSMVFHDASKIISDSVYEDLLIKKKGVGNNNVVFEAGGTGVGKTFILQNLDNETLRNAPITYDSNLANFDTAVVKIQQAIDAGYEPKIYYIYGDPYTSFKEGVLPRVLDEGRAISINVHVQKHSESAPVILKLKKHFGDKLDVTVIEGAMKEEGFIPDKVNILENQQALDFLKERTYNIINTSKLYEYAKQAKQQGKLTEAEFNTITEQLGKGDSKNVEGEKSKSVQPEESSLGGKNKGNIQPIKQVGLTKVTPEMVNRPIPKANKNGDCYDSAGKYVIENNDPSLVLVHGMVDGQGPLKGIRFDHAWVEKGDEVIDVSNGKNLKLPKDLYYAIGNIKENQLIRYSREKAIENMTGIGNYGPWEAETKKYTAPENQKFLKDIANKVEEGVREPKKLIDEATVGKNIPPKKVIEQQAGINRPQKFVERTQKQLLRKEEIVAKKAATSAISKYKAGQKFLEQLVNDIKKSISVPKGKERSRIAFVKKLGEFNQTVSTEIKNELGIERPISQMNLTELQDFATKLKERLKFKYEKGYRPSLQTKEILKLKDDERPQLTEIDYEDNRKIVLEKKTIKENLQKFGEKIASGLSKTLAPISTRLENIDPSLKYAMRKFEYDLMQSLQKDKNKITPYLKKIKGISKDDFADLDLALKNGDIEKINEINKKNKIEKEFIEIRTVLNDLYNRANKVGFDIGYKKDYWPRVIKDTEGFLEHFGKQDYWSILDQAIKGKELELGRYLLPEEKANLINNMIRGYQGGQITLSGTGSMKNRVIDLVTPEINKFYYNSPTSLVKYVQEVNEKIGARKFFGKGNKKEEFNNIEDSVGAYTADLSAKGKITPKQELELRDMLNSRFNPKGTHGLIGIYKNLAYINVMGSFLNAVTQLGDQAWSIYRGGLWGTLKADLKSMIGKAPITKESLGIEADSVAQEFSDSGKLAKTVDKIFTLTGLNKMDRLGKQALVNSAIEKYQKMAENPKVDFLKKLDEIFGKESEQVLQDLKNGEITENVKLLAFNELLDFHPISLSEMPEQYLKGGNGRIFYMLKSYTLKQFDIFRREAFREMKRGNWWKGIRNLLYLSSLIMLTNGTASEIKDLLTNRKTKLSDRVIDQITMLAGFSRYSVNKISEVGLGSALLEQITPPTNFVDNMSKDLLNLYKDPEENANINKLKSIQDIPLIGKFYYWWFGKGASDTEKYAPKEEASKGLPSLPSLPKLPKLPSLPSL